MFRIAAALLAFVVATSAYAQDAAPADTSASSSGGVTHSIYGGFSLTKFEFGGASDDDVESSAGLETGYSLLVPFTSGGFGLRTGAGIVQKSSTVETVTGIFTDEYTITLTYIEIPVTAFIPFGRGPVAGIAGANLDILVDDDCEEDFGVCPAGASDDYKDLVVNAVLGARFRLGGPSSRHNLEALFEFGVTDIDENDSKVDISHSGRYVYNF